YRVRFGSKVSRATRIEVVTEGIFSRQIFDDPELTGVAAVLFDEFHERSLDGDLGLALARDAQTGLREDLRIVVMSATLDGARVAKLLGEAPVVASEGRAFAVETRYLGRKADAPLERQMADAIAMALRADAGSVLAFLPGAAEIRRTQNLLAERIHDASVEIVPLFGALDAAVQDRAIAPPPKGRRKVVLATSIAETSLTIEGVRIVVDSGMARVQRDEPDIGLTRLETVRASRAAVDQRRGRAGRIEAGVCYRLWDEPQTAALAAYTQPEILSADLSSLVLDLAQWGVSDPAELAFLDSPPLPALKEARSLLRELGALDGEGRITAEGKSLRALALPPRLARMIVDSHRLGGGREAAEIAAVLTERGLGGDSVDLDARLDLFRRDRSQRASSARALAQRWASQVAATENAASAPSPYPQGGAELTSGVMLALAFPDRVARNRGDGSFLLANGRGAAVDRASALARAPSAETARVLADGLIAAGLDKLPWPNALKQWRDRVMFLRKAEGAPWPDLSDEALAAEREQWLVPALFEKTALKDFSAPDLSQAVMALLPWELRARLEREAPTHFEAPTGTRVPIDYEAEQGPTIAVRLQELFGLNTHPSIAKGAV